MCADLNGEIASSYRCRLGWLFLWQLRSFIGVAFLSDARLSTKASVSEQGMSLVKNAKTLVLFAYPDSARHLPKRSDAWAMAKGCSPAGQFHSSSGR